MFSGHKKVKYTGEGKGKRTKSVLYQNIISSMVLFPCVPDIHSFDSGS